MNCARGHQHLNSDVTLVGRHLHIRARRAPCALESAARGASRSRPASRWEGRGPRGWPRHSSVCGQCPSSARGSVIARE